VTRPHRPRPARPTSDPADPATKRDRQYHAAWRGYRYIGSHISFERITGFADHRSFEVIEWT
jgi:hypothetical protein